MLSLGHLQTALWLWGMPLRQVHTLHEGRCTCAAEGPAQEQDSSHAQEPGRTEMSAESPPQLRHSSGLCSMQPAMSSGAFPEASMAVWGQPDTASNVREG